MHILKLTLSRKPVAITENCESCQQKPFRHVLNIILTLLRIGAKALARRNIPRLDGRRIHRRGETEGTVWEEWLSGSVLSIDGTRHSLDGRILIVRTLVLNNRLVPITARSFRRIPRLIMAQVANIAFYTPRARSLLQYQIR